MSHFRAIVLTAVSLLAPTAHAQDAGTSGGAAQALVDIDALVIATQVTTRCAVHDQAISYLTPLEATAAEYHLRQLESAASNAIEDLANEMARMRAEAAAIACGHEGLAPFMDYGRQIAQDMTDIALLAWQRIPVRNCAYFRDNGFMVAIARAEDASADFTLSTEPVRAAYIEDRASQWVSVFESNCANPSFDPTLTLPGLIALALPIETNG